MFKYECVQNVGKSMWGWIKKERKLVNAKANKTGTSKVGAISKAQKAQTFRNCERGYPLGFLKKKKNRKRRILSQGQKAKKLERGEPLGFLKLQFAVKYQNTWRGDPLETKNFQKNVA